jgi:hypothetical protein
MEKTMIFLPPHGCIGKIAKLTGYSRTTVTNALRNRSRGLKADKVRKIYLEKYSTTKQSF